MAKKNHTNLMEGAVLVADIVIIALILGEWWSGNVTNWILIIGTLGVAILIGILTVCVLDGHGRKR